jgi:hypothetical protein
VSTCGLSIKIVSALNPRISDSPCANISTGPEGAFTNGKLARKASLPALEKGYVRLAAVRAPDGNLNNWCQMQPHETVTSFRKTSLGPNRKFGLAFGALFAILGLWPLFHQAGSPKWGLIAVSTAIPGRRTPSLATPLRSDA